MLLDCQLHLAHSSLGKYCVGHLKKNRRDRREESIFLRTDKKIGNLENLVARGRAGRESLICLGTAALCCGPKSCQVGVARTWVFPGSL